MDYAIGTDVSRYESPCNYELGRKRGLRFAFIRATVGDYYTDPALRSLYDGYKSQGCLVSFYLVTAPKDPTQTRSISASAHLDRFFNSISGLPVDLPYVDDAELNRGETADKITKLNQDVVYGLSNGMRGKMPIIYTRKSWWDVYVKQSALWSACDLFAARYKTGLTCPWSDGYCKFRDWKEWKFWQYTATADGAYWGFADKEGDLDYYNGTEQQLYEYAGLPIPLSMEDKVNIMWRELKAHHPDWNYGR